MNHADVSFADKLYHCALASSIIGGKGCCPRARAGLLSRADADAAVGDICVYPV